MSYNVFGYGSLISPYSVIGRFSDEIPSVDTVYQNRLRYEEDNITRPQEEKVLEEEYDRLQFKPVKLEGFVRTYTFESERGGAMLETYYTGRNDDMINGVIISGLNDGEFEDINEYESEYEKYTVQPSEFDLYDKICAYKIESEATVYVGGKNEKSNWGTDCVRNQTYHSRILSGIDYLGRIYNQELRDAFWKDFVENTYEHPYITLDIGRDELNQF